MALWLLTGVEQPMPLGQQVNFACRHLLRAGCVSVLLTLIWPGCTLTCCPPRHGPAAALGIFCYTSTTTGFQYCLNSIGDDFAGAQRACSLAASNLVSYGSLKEQQEVENYFIDSGGWEGPGSAYLSLSLPCTSYADASASPRVMQVLGC